MKDKHWTETSAALIINKAPHAFLSHTESAADGKHKGVTEFEKMVHDGGAGDLRLDIDRLRRRPREERRLVRAEGRGAGEEGSRACGQARAGRLFLPRR